MFRKIIKFESDPELLIEILGLDTVEGFSVTEKKESKDVVDRQKVIKVIGDYHAKIIENMFKDIKHFDTNKAFAIAKRSRDLEKLINKIERAE